MEKRVIGFLITSMLTVSVWAQPTTPETKPGLDASSRSNPGSSKSVVDRKSPAGSSLEAERQKRIVELEAEITRLQAENQELKKKNQAYEQLRNSKADSYVQKGGEKKPLLHYRRPINNDAVKIDKLPEAEHL